MIGAPSPLLETEVAIIGGGIVGLAIAHEILRRRPKTPLVVLEKESRVALHQSGRNSGVIHSGIYYPPGTLKARLARAGCESIKDFCREHSIPFRTTGKLIVAVDETEIDRLRKLSERGRLNEIEVEELDATEARRIEPAISCVRALYVPSAGVVNYGIVAEHLRRRIEQAGGSILLGFPVIGIDRKESSILIRTPRGPVAAKLLVNAAGLFSDRIATMDGIRSAAQIVPFRGEYYEISSPSADLVRGLIYPVPDVRYPFLGVHLTRSIDDVVHAGPNAVLAFAREGYRWRDVSLRDMLETLRFSGFWRFGARHARMAAGELHRSLSRSRFVDSARRLVPAIRDEDLHPSPAGVRAQALGPEGELVDDFVIEKRDEAFHILNAPSPAATSSLEIAREIVDRLSL